MSNFRQSLIPFAGLALAIVLIVAVRPASTQILPGLKPASDVNVVNTPTVNAKQSGPWSVSIAGTPSVRVATPVGINPAENTVKVDSSTPILVRAVEQPYSVYLEANNFNNGSAEVCTDIPVPEGMRLALETVFVRVLNNPAFEGDPCASVRMVLSREISTVFDRLVIPLTVRLPPNDYSGHLQTRLLSGVTVGDGTVVLSLCAAQHTSIRGYVVGSLMPL